MSEDNLHELERCLGIHLAHERQPEDPLADGIAGHFQLMIHRKGSLHRLTRTACVARRATLEPVHGAEASNKNYHMAK